MIPERCSFVFYMILLREIERKDCLYYAEVKSK